MSTVALSGTDTVIQDGIVQSGLADGDAVLVEFKEDLAKVKIGKEGNASIALNQMGRMIEVTYRYIRGSTDDKAMNSRVQQFISNTAGFVLGTAEYIKKVGDGTGNAASDTIVASSGVPSRQPNWKSNPEGDPEQGISVYKWTFAKAVRIIT